MSTTRLTWAGVGVFLLLLVCGALGFCGKPKDHQPKPAPSSSTSKPVEKPKVAESKIPEPSIAPTTKSPSPKSSPAPKESPSVKANEVEQTKEFKDSDNNGDVNLPGKFW